MGKALKPKRLLFCVSLLLSFLFSSQRVDAAAPDNWIWTARNTGMSGLSIQDMVMDPTDSNKLYVLTAGFGVYKSTDAGANWSAVNTGLPSDKSHAYDLEIDPNNAPTLFVVLGPGQKIYKTTDGGSNWSLSHTGIRSWGTGNGIRDIRVDPTDSNVVYAGSTVSGDDGGVWKSTDGGANWTQVAGSNMSGSGIGNDAGPFAIDSSDNQKIYAGHAAYEGVYISTNGGSNWSLNTQTSGVYTLLIDASDNNKIYAGGITDLYISEDGGSNWSLSGQLSGRIYAIAQSSSNHNVLYAGGTSDAFKSTDGGENWSSLNLSSDFNDGSVRAIAIDPADEDTVYFATSTGIYKSTDGGSNVIASNTGIPSNPTNVLEIDTNLDNNLFAITSSGLYKSTDGGVNWSLLTSNCISSVEFHPSNTDEIFCTGTVILYKSIDGGENWSTLYNSGDIFINKFAVDQNNPDIIYISTFDASYNVPLKKSSDGGQSFSTKVTLSGVYGVYSLQIDPLDSSRVYMPTYHDYFWKSTNTGENWSKVTSGLTADLYQMTVDSNNGNLYCSKSTSGNTFYKSTDHGVSWTSIDTGVAGSPTFRKIVVDRTDSDVLYVIEKNDRTTYKSTNGGDDWAALTTTGLPVTPDGNYLAQDPTDKTRLLLGMTSSGGIYSYENYIPVFSSSTISVADENGGVVEAGDTLTYGIYVTNSGWANGNNINLRVDIPSGLTYVANSTKVDGTTISPDPTSSPTINVSLGDETKDESIEVTFRATINSDQGVGTTIGISGLITSDEDILGTLTSTGYIIVGKFPTSSIGLPGEACGKSSPLSPTALRGIPGPKADQATLYWEKPSSGEISHYALAYGKNSGEYLYGATNIGNQTSYTISGLKPCTDYYFTVAAINDCASSGYSQEFKVKTNCLLVKEGEEKEMVREIEEEVSEIGEEEEQKKDEVKGEGYTVKVKVRDEKDQPVQGAKVILHSEPREEIADEQGIALFNNVEKGEHKILIAHKNQEGEQEVNLEGEVKEFDFTIQIKPANPFLSTPVILVIGALALSLGILSFLYFKKR